MNKKLPAIIRILGKLYPNPKPSLRFRTPFESLVATMLSAQCTDERVNLVTRGLFKIADTPEKILKLGAAKLEVCIKPTGFYRTKAKSVIGTSKMLVEKFAGKVPRTLENLQKLPGVGRKTASVVLAQAFHIPAFPVDRHILRVANRLGLAHSGDPTETDLELRKNIPEKHWIPLHLQLICHGRKICRLKPTCGTCPLLSYCPDGKKRIKSGERLK